MYIHYDFYVFLFISKSHIQYTVYIILHILNSNLLIFNSPFTSLCKTAGEVYFQSKLT